MHYGVLRFFREQFQIEFSDSQTGEIVKHLGAVNKSLRKKGKGNLPNKSDALTNKETHLFFEGKAAGDDHPKALRNAIQVFSLILGRRGATEQRSFCFGDMIVIGPRCYYYDECCYCYDRKQYSIVIRKELYVIIFKVIIKI